MYAYPDTVLVLAVLLAAIGVAAAGVMSRLLIVSASRPLLVRNFRGTDIPAVGGLVLLTTFLIAEAIMTFVSLIGAGTLAGDANIALDPSALPRTFLSADHFGILIVVLGFFLLGVVDDLMGAGQAKGFRGHLLALRRGELTGGAIKALGGGLVGFIAGGLWELELGPALIDAGIIALAANLLNLFDMRPGRATKAFFIGWIPLAIFGVADPYLPITAAIAAAAGVWLWTDLRETAMLGDSGANLLGGVLGACLCLAADGLAKLAILFILVALTVLSEKFSFTQIIQTNRALRWVDGLGRVRE